MKKELSRSSHPPMNMIQSQNCIGDRDLRHVSVPNGAGASVWSRWLFVSILSYLRWKHQIVQYHSEKALEPTTRSFSWRRACGLLAPLRSPHPSTLLLTQQKSHKRLLHVGRTFPNIPASDCGEARACSPLFRGGRHRSLAEAGLVLTAKHERSQPNQPRKHIWPGPTRHAGLFLLHLILIRQLPLHRFYTPIYPLLFSHIPKNGL